MEYKFQIAENSELTFTPTESENKLLREAIRKQLAAAATGQIVLDHLAAVTLIHYLDIIGNEPSQIMSVCCRREHLSFFTDALHSAMRDYQVEDLVAADQLAREFQQASIETEAGLAGMTLPDFVPYDL